MQILLVRLRLIGDVVFTTPAIRAMRRQYPQARLTYLVEEAAAAAQSLQDQANELARVVSIFKLQEGDERMALAAAPAPAPVVETAVAVTPRAKPALKKPEPAAPKAKKVVAAAASEEWEEF